MKRDEILLCNLILAVAAMVISCAPLAAAGKKAAQALRPDMIEVIAHLPLGGTPQRNLLISEHWRRQYLYMRSFDGHVSTVIDVTTASSPKLIQRVAAREPGRQLGDVVGTAVLEIEVAPGEAAKPARTVSITSFANLEQPRVIQQFTKVTDLVRDRQRGLIYLINDQGLYILQERPAVDQELEDEYGAYVLYNR